jgi:hypothetical protein
MPKGCTCGRKAGTRYNVIFRNMTGTDSIDLCQSTAVLLLVNDSHLWLAVKMNSGITTCTNSLFTEYYTSCGTIYTAPRNLNRWLVLQHTAIIIFVSKCDLHIDVRV